jgi:hypothetical protein
MKPELKDLRFYVIYSFDIYHDQSVKPFQPPNVKQWDMTEDDNQYEFDYLGKDYENGKHRKYVADLSYEQFNRFVDHLSLVASDVETMGSLTEFGVLPAISFDGLYYDGDDAIFQNAYVTPYLPDVTLDDNRWEEIKSKMIETYK